MKITKKAVEPRLFKMTVENGVAMSESSFPFLVKLALVEATGLTVMCGGIALTERLVLTAKHCLDLANSILVGTSSLFSFSIIGSKNELTLIRTVEGPLPARWPGPMIKIADIPPNSDFVALGWGGPQINLARPQLRRSNLLQREPEQVCRMLYSQNLEANELCIGRARMSPCRRDSGGPLFTATGTDESPALGGLIGIVRTADRDCLDTGPAIIACFNDDEFNWIQDQISL